MYSLNKKKNDKYFVSVRNDIFKDYSYKHLEMDVWKNTM